jgi:hypothetical protein
MRNLLAFAAAAALTFGGVGWYLDWFHVRSGPVTSDGHQNVNIDINGPKIARDVHKGVEVGEKKLQQIVDKQGQAQAKNPGEVTKLDPPPPASLPTPTPTSSGRAPIGPDGH